MRSDGVVLDLKGGAGTCWYDNSGFDNHCTLNNANHRTTYNGVEVVATHTTAHVVPHSNTLNTPRGLTLGIWLIPEDATTSIDLFLKGNAVSDADYMRLRRANSIIYFYYGNSNSVNAGASSYTEYGVPIFIAVTQIHGGAVSFYKNGALVTSTGAVSLTMGTDDLKIGYSAGDDYIYKPLMLSYPMSAPAIANLYQEGAKALGLVTG